MSLRTRGRDSSRSSEVHESRKHEAHSTIPVSVLRGSRLVGSFTAKNAPADCSNRPGQKNVDSTRWRAKSTRSQTPEAQKCWEGHCRPSKSQCASIDRHQVSGTHPSTKTAIQRAGSRRLKHQQDNGQRQVQAEMVTRDLRRPLHRIKGDPAVDGGPEDDMRWERCPNMMKIRSVPHLVHHSRADPRPCRPDGRPQSWVSSEHFGRNGVDGERAGKNAVPDGVFGRRRHEDNEENPQIPVQLVRTSRHHLFDSIAHPALFALGTHLSCRAEDVDIALGVVQHLAKPQAVQHPSDPGQVPLLRPVTYRAPQPATYSRLHDLRHVELWPATPRLQISKTTAIPLDSSLLPSMRTGLCAVTSTYKQNNFRDSDLRDTSALPAHYAIDEATVRYGLRARASLDLLPALEPSCPEESPASFWGWGNESDAEDGHSTPFTSPLNSPRNPTSTTPQIWKLSKNYLQLDGTGGGANTKQASTMDLAHEQDERKVPRQDSVLTEPGETEEKASLRIDRFTHSEGGTSSSTENACQVCSDFESDNESENDGKEPEETTSLKSASPRTTPPPPPPPALARRSRHPSMLLRSCERRLTPRQTRLVKKGLESPNRFIPVRTSPMNKDALLLQRTTRKKPGPQPLYGLHHLESDPFGPTPRRSLRMAEQYATVRMPQVPPRSSLNTVTPVPDARSPQVRAASASAVWHVSRTVVTEGVASVTNGRGGRVTSGSSAAHYSADFLRKTTPSEEELMHGRRLAIAMDIDQGARMMRHSPASSPASAADSPTYGKQTFRDGRWEADSQGSPTKPRPKKTKDIPVIPFRVLDAPALRDDYYCSLLAYSPTVECLAVGLGPHVYLWAESRTKSIPDSLTASYGSAHVTSVSFSSTEGGSAILAIGRADGRITLWSPLDLDPRFDSEQPAPVSCVAFRPLPVRRSSIRDPIATVSTEELLVGDEAGFVYYYSVEWPNQDQRDLFDWHGSMTLLARISCHTQQVCRIAWSGDGKVFATGGNDNCLYLYNSKTLLRRNSSRQNNAATTTRAVHVRRGNDSSENTTNPTDRTIPGQGDVPTLTLGSETHTFTLNAAVKALVFAPWQPSLLAAGGGSNDRCIHFFHAQSGARLATIDCYAQVTALVWSPRRREIAATFGFAQPEHPYRVAVFAWPSGDLLVAIPWWGEERALYAVLYPGGPATGGRSPGGSGTAGPRHARRDAEGRPWYGRRTREEGCLVVATSDASIKFHEIWAERPGDGRGGQEGMMGTWGVNGGVLGGSQILEGECSEALARRETIR